jgi:hypothetical protein
MAFAFFLVPETSDKSLKQIEVHRRAPMHTRALDCGAMLRNPSNLAVAEHLDDRTWSNYRKSRE